MSIVLVMLAVGMVLIYVCLVFQVMDWLDRRRISRQMKENIDRFNAFVEEQREIWRSIGH